jgi:hypothetical protein
MIVRWTERGQLVFGDLLTEQGDRCFASLTEQGQAVQSRSLTYLGAASLGGSGAVAASGQGGHAYGAVSLSGEGTIVASGYNPVILAAGSSLSGSGTLAASATSTKFGAATVQGVGGLTAVGISIILGAAIASALGSTSDVPSLAIVTGTAVAAGVGTASVFSGYTIIGRGRSGQRQLEFLFHKVNRLGLYQGDLTPYIISGSVKMDQDLDVKCQGHFVMQEVPGLNFLAEYMMPVIRITEDGVTTDYELAIFRLGWPKRTYSPVSAQWDVDAYDLTVHLLEDAFENPYTVLAGANPTEEAKAIATAAGFDYVNFPAVSIVMEADKSWDVGTPKLRAVADLLDAGGCWSPWMSNIGWLTSGVRRELAEIPIAATYVTDADSLVLAPASVETDVTRFANKVIIRVKNPDLEEPLSASYTNTKEESPVSVPALGGRVITKVIDANNIQTQAEADARARQECEQAASVYQSGSLVTGLDPERGIHEAYDLQIYRNGGSPLLAGKWWCKGWTMQLAVGGTMTHQVARVEGID